MYTLGLRSMVNTKVFARGSEARAHDSQAEQISKTLHKAGLTGSGTCKVCGVTGSYEEIAMAGPSHKRFCALAFHHFVHGFGELTAFGKQPVPRQRWKIFREAGFWFASDFPFFLDWRCQIAPIALSKSFDWRCHFCGARDGAHPGGHHQAGARQSPLAVESKPC